MFHIYKIASHPTVDFAAEELKKYLRMMMTECGEIEISYKPDATDGFHLGLMSDFALDTSEAEDEVVDDILHIDTNAEGGIIAGNNYRSILLSVYKYLTLNGCRWLFPGIDGEFIPAKDVEPTFYHKLADNRFRGWCNEGAEFQPNMMEVIDFAPKIGLNTFMLEFFNPRVYYEYYYNHTYNANSREPEPVTPLTCLQWKRQCEAEIAKRSLQFHDIGHAWCTISFGLDPDKKFDYLNGETNEQLEAARPYLAMVDGKRDLVKGTPMSTNCCMSNPETRAKMVKCIADYAERSPHVTYLHVWGGDSINKCCECEECQKKSHPDWLVILFNEIDKELTLRALSTRIIHAAGYDSRYPPQTEKLNNPKRFSIMLAPITRHYTESVSTDITPITLPEYKRNQNDMITDPNIFIAYAKEWEKRAGEKKLIYEYHFWVNKTFEPTGLHYARIIHEDIKAYRKHGFLGLIEDGTQRCFFPNGFAFYVYATTLFDCSIPFETMKEDYFSRAYGEDWHEVEIFFEKLTECFDHKYMTGQRSANPSFGKYYNPAMADRFRRVPELTAEFRTFIEEHKNMPMRAQTVSMRLLCHFLDYCDGFSEFLVIKCLGGNQEARKMYLKFLDDFGKREVEIERYFDMCDFGKSMVWRILGKKDEPLNFGI